MTHPINTFQDILDAISQNPGLKEELRRLILTEELISLPSVVGIPAPGVGTIAEQLHGLNSRLGSIEGQMGGIESQMETLNGKLGRLTGEDYDGQAAEFGDRRIRDSLDLHQVQLIYRYMEEGRKHLNELMAPAVIEGIIEERLVDELEDVALIFMGHTGLDPESPVRYAVTEVSTTIELHHVSRARRRAAIMNSAPGIEAVAAVIGTAITPEARQALGLGCHCGGNGFVRRGVRAGYRGTSGQGT